MSVHLQRLRVRHTTDVVANAGTDDWVDLQFYVDGHAYTTYLHGWNTVRLDSPRDDRERGETEAYEIDFTNNGDLGISLSGTSVPRGIAFTDFEHVRYMALFLHIRGSDWWRASSYRVEGAFKEMQFVPGTIDAHAVIDHGWLLMRQSVRPLEMSTDRSEGTAWHHLIIDGPLFVPIVTTQVGVHADPTA